MTMTECQTPTDEKPDRTDHIWIKVGNRRWKCTLCGAITNKEPPPYPTPRKWEADSYEKLTDDERRMSKPR